MVYGKPLLNFVNLFVFIRQLLLPAGKTDNLITIYKVIGFVRKEDFERKSL